MLTETFSDFTRSFTNFLQLRYLAVLSETIEEVMSLTPPSDRERVTLVRCSGKLSTAHDLTVVPIPFDMLLKKHVWNEGPIFTAAKVNFQSYVYHLILVIPRAITITHMNHVLFIGY